MGTLLDQAPRNSQDVDLDAFLSEAVALATKHSITVADVIAAVHASELKRRNDLYVNNGDAFDEQIAGIGELLAKLCEAVEDLNPQQ